ncbi:MAG: hypothetical protein HY098_07045 [Nitrospinae bacterium]|nr:hypothetical protein [Nitrospinota bacterium]
MRKTVLCLVVAALFPFAAASAESVYVQSAKARVMKEPNFTSAESGIAKRGDKLLVVEKGNGWTKVSSEKNSGWVNVLCISDSPPLDNSGIMKGAKDISSMSRRRASAVTSAAASRGLTEAERKRLSEGGALDYKSLMWAENVAYSVTEKEIDEFIPPGAR